MFHKPLLMSLARRLIRLVTMLVLVLMTTQLMTSSVNSSTLQVEQLVEASHDIMLTGSGSDLISIDSDSDRLSDDSSAGGGASPGGVGSNLQLWLKADAGTSSSTDGSAVSSWSDQSPNGYTATDTDVNAPTYQNEASDLLNFNPVLRFDGVDDGLHLGSNYIFSSNDGLNIFAVVRPESTTSRPRQFILDFGQMSDEGYGVIYSSQNSGMYASTSAGGAFTDSPVHSHGTSPTLITSRIDFGTEQRLYLNGLSVYDASITLSQLTAAEINENPTPGSSQGPVMIARQSKTGILSSNGGRLFVGDYAELVVYDNDLSQAQRQQVNSYLALKYGITLDQSSAQDYVASDGNVIYAATTTLDSYDKDIAGIGRDNSSTLAQPKSKSINSGSIVTMDKGGSFANDKDFVVWGHDGGAKTASTSGLPTGVDQWLERKWAVQETGNAGAVTISVATTDLSALTASGALALIVADNTAFTSNLQTHALTTNGANQEVSVTFDGTKYFTFARSSALAVDLSHFFTEVEGEQVRLHWATVSEINNLGFNVWRSTAADAPTEQLNSNLISGQAPGSGQGSSYEFVDQDVEAGISYFYWLEDVDMNGSTTWHGPVSATITDPTAVTTGGLTIRSQPSLLWALLPMGLLLLASVYWRKRQH